MKSTLRAGDHLACSYNGARNSVVSEVIIDIHRVSRVGIVESARNGDRRPQLRRPAARDRDLRALDVELWDSRGPGIVNCQRLDAEEIVPILNAGGEVEGVRFCGVILLGKLLVFG